ncbi:MAG: V-type ATP synthase subunit I [Christensenellales bacterium]
MAILGMKKIALISHKDNKEALLKSMQRLGAVEVVFAAFDGIAPSAASEKQTHMEAMLSDVRIALDTIQQYDDKKSSFFEPKPLISANQLNNARGSINKAAEIIDSIKRLNSDFASQKSRRQRLKNHMAQLAPYACFDIPLETLGDGKYTFSFLGTLPDENKQNFERLCEEYSDAAYVECSESDKGLFSVYIIAHNDIKERFIGELKYMGFSDAPSKDSRGTPACIISAGADEYDALLHETLEGEKKAKEYSKYKSLLFLLEDYLLTELARERCREKLGETSAAFVLEGWVIADECENIKQELEKTAPEAYISFHDPADDETPPTVLSNSRLTAPFEAVTNMYDVPSSRGFDPNMIMAFFYFIIFGMMMADVVYGIVLTLGAFLMLRIKKPEGMFRKITTVIMICGVSSFLWGFFYGTILSIEGIPYVLNPLADSQSALLTLVLCLAVGLVHIFTGLIIGMYVDIRRGNFLDAIYDRFSWILLVGGIIMLLFGGILGTVGLYMALAGGAILLFTQGRHKKGFVKKLIGGLASLYGISGYIGDILSYCRIFGMGLATTVIAMVFNTIGGMLMGNIIGYIFGIVVLTVGHVFNIAINTLGAFVHTARLQYIEFYNKFYEGGGRLFKPLSINTRHHRMGD